MRIFLTIGHLILLMVISLSLRAQQQITGTVQNAEGRPLSYANALLLSAIDSSLVKGAVSEEDGGFLFEGIGQGTFLLSISMVGYRKHLEKLEERPEQVIKLPPTVLYESDDTLEEITITAQKPLYEKQVDRLVVNVAESITAEGNSILQILQKSPGVVVNQSNNTLTLNGRPGILVMVNNRMTRLPLDAVIQMLDGMSAANVEKIELITNPPARYDAEGAAGIIHIVLAESADEGTSSTFGLTAGKRAAEILGTDFNLNHRSKNVSLFLDYSILHDRNIQYMTKDLRVAQPGFISRFASSIERFPLTVVQNLRAGVDIGLGKKTKIGSLVTLYERNWILDAFTSSHNRVSPDSTLSIDMATEEKNRWRSLTANFNLTHTFNARHELRFDLDYLAYHNHNPSSYAIDMRHVETDMAETTNLEISKETPISFIVSKLDYTYRVFDNLNLQSGAKLIASSFDNKVEVHAIENGQKTRNNELSSMAYLTEKIKAVYVAAEWKIDAATQVNVGLRYEHTGTSIRSDTGEKLVDRDFGNFFPSLFVKRTIKEDMEFYVGYSKRITRPTFNDMAPFVYLIDPNTFASGNPALLPAILDGIKLDFRMGRAILSLDYSHSKNEIARIQPEFDPVENLVVLRSQNLEFLKTYGITFSVPWIVTDFWDIQVNAIGQNQQFKTAHLDQNLANSIYALNLTMVNTVRFPRNYSLEIMGNFQSKRIWGMQEYSPYGSLNLGVQKKLREDKGTFSLGVDDVFYTNVWKTKTHLNDGVHMDIGWDLHFQSVRLTYRRNFGNRKLRAVSIQSGSADEQKRVQ